MFVLNEKVYERPTQVYALIGCYKSSAIDELQILELLQHGPVAAAVDARTWMNYQGGIIQYHCETSVNHAIQIIGYDLTGTTYLE